MFKLNKIVIPTLTSDSCDILVALTMAFHSFDIHNEHSWRNEMCTHVQYTIASQDMEYNEHRLTCTVYTSSI